MKPLRLYLKDFMCYDWAYIDFTQFNSALLVGKAEGDPAEANGVGKTTIFKSIEYVLFNQSNFNLERIIRDDALFCQVVFDFVIHDKEYRLARTRTRKGSTDLSLYQRTAAIGSEGEVWHDDKHIALFDDKFWKDISGRRAGDTEKDLVKLLKINYKSFRTFVHFVQNDFSSLATATPEKRKAILKDALNLVIYPKLEKLAKEKLTSLSRELDRINTLVESLGNPEESIDKLNIELSSVESELVIHVDSLQQLENDSKLLTQQISELVAMHALLEGKFSVLVNRERALIQSKGRIEFSVKDHSFKKSGLIQEARDLLAEVKSLENMQKQLISLDYEQMGALNEQLEKKKVLVTQHNINIQTSLLECEELKIPMPTGSVCKNCRQPMDEQHRQECLVKDQAKMLVLQSNIKESKIIIGKLQIEIQEIQQTIGNLTVSKRQLENTNTKIDIKKKEIMDKRFAHDECVKLLAQFYIDLKDKEQELVQVQEELAQSSIEEDKILQHNIKNNKEKLLLLTAQISTANKGVTHYSNHKAIVLHTIEQKKLDQQKKIDLTKLIRELETKLSVYPLVIQTFSSTGIPNLIIHNILDALQLEVNKLLEQFKPGLQLFFFIEKIKGNGTETDTLDITYQVNGKDRYYEQLSGAMQLMVLFSLKLGMSFLLQNLLGIDIKFLLLDELDQSLSKGRIDAFADIIKFLQKDFTILVISHNDRLKDKFKNIILVEQDINMVSTAQVVSSW